MAPKLQVKDRQHTCREHGLTNSPGRLCASLAFAAKLKCRPASPPNLLFHIKCRCPVSCPRSLSHSSCSTCPSFTKTACPLLSLSAPLNSAHNSPTLRPKPRLASATCARLGSRGMLSPSFPRVLRFVALCPGLSVCIEPPVLLSAVDLIRPYLQLRSPPQQMRASSSPRLPPYSPAPTLSSRTQTTHRSCKTRFKAAAMPLQAAPGGFLQFSTKSEHPNFFKISSTTIKTTTASRLTKSRTECARATAYLSTWPLPSSKNAGCQLAPNARLLHQTAISRQLPPPRPLPPPAPRLLRPRPPSTPPRCCAS